MAGLFRHKPNAFEKRFGKDMKDFKPLGKGKYGVVYLVPDPNKLGVNYAVKVISKKKLETKEDILGLALEIKILKEIDHPRVIKIYEAMEDSRNHYLVLENMGGGELFERIVAKGSYSEKEAAVVVTFITQALLYCHQKNIVHRDLKPENLLLLDKNDDTTVKIADFGFATYCHEPITDGCGTMLYIAPEILTCIPYKSEVDMWSLGVIVYILLCGYPPFYHPDDQEMAKKIVRGKFIFKNQDWDQISQEAKHLIKNLLNIETRERFTAEQVLQHPWVRNVEELSAAPIDTISKNLRDFRAKMLFSKALNGVLAVEQMRTMLKGYEAHADDQNNEEENNQV